MPLLLLPNVFSDEQTIQGLLPSGLSEICESLDGLIAESERSGRRYLLKVNPGSQKMRTLPIRLLNEHSEDSDLLELEMMIKKGGNWGLISDAGLPCIADPGSKLVLRLRKSAFPIPIQAFPGPSSIFLSLMLSGLPGQRFTFHGYLPKESQARIQFLRKIEQSSSEKEETQIWIETPYRNRYLLETIVQTLDDKTLLSVATNLTFADEKVKTMTIEKWKNELLEEGCIPNVPAVFLIFAKKKNDTHKMIPRVDTSPKKFQKEKSHRRK